MKATKEQRVSLLLKRRARPKEATRGTVRAHQPGQAVFRTILPEEIDWQPFAAFPPSVRLAVVVGQSLQDGPYTIRVKVPRGVKLMPHSHPEDRVYTVISGIFYIGLGDEFNEEQLQAYPPGSAIILPGHTSHFHWAKSGAYVTQITAMGPLGLEYMNAQDDLRNERRTQRMKYIASGKESRPDRREASSRLPTEEGSRDARPSAHVCDYAGA